MFCPLSADWGNVADWVSGLGSFAAVLVALGIAWNDHRKRLAEKVEAVQRDAEMENRFRVEALFLIRRIARITHVFQEQIRDGAVFLDKAWKQELRDCAETALRYQQMREINFAAYLVMDEVAKLGRRAGDVDELQMEDMADVLGSVMYQCEHVSECIKNDANPGAPFNW